MQFHPKGLLVTGVFVGLVWFAVERGSGLTMLAAVVAAALEATLSFGWRLIPDERFSWFRGHRV
jgi:hypothetical protein